MAIRSRHAPVKGFTLVEVIVVLAIIGVLSGVLWARLAMLVPIYRLEGAARALAGELQRARLRAIAEGKCYMVALDTSAKTYQLQSKLGAVPCGSSGFAAVSGEGGRNIDDAGSLSVSFTAGSNPIFTPRGKGETSPAPVISLTNSAGAVRSIYVQSVGRIYVQ